MERTPAEIVPVHPVDACARIHAPSLSNPAPPGISYIHSLPLVPINNPATVVMLCAVTSNARVPLCRDTPKPTYVPKLVRR